MMKIGAIFPQTEFGNDPGAIREYAQAAESLGYHHIMAYDHVLGADPERPKPLIGPYTYQDPFHEVFVLYSFMSAVTNDIEFATGILILPQRQTALVAKQAATLDVLSGGRLRLGVAIGWNWVEYEALNQNFHTRGRRIEEQVRLLRKLWGEPLVSFTGEWHNFTKAGLNPLPIQRPIPIWFGGHADQVLRRAARMGDGWLPGYRTAEDALPSIERLREYLNREGRSWKAFGLEPRLYYENGEVQRWQRVMDGWNRIGATHFTLNTMRCGFETPDQHIKALREFASFAGIGS